MAEAPRITTRLASNLLTCRFATGRTLSERLVFFRSAEEAKGSPLAEAVFAVPGVASVKISGETVSVTRETSDDWPSVTRPVARAIEAHLASGRPAVREGAPSNVPSEAEIRERVAEILERDINPAVASHGGYIELIDVKAASVFVRLGGGCQGCGMANVTLKQGVERTLREAIPELDEVLDTTDHAGGANPYYAPSKK